MANNYEIKTRNGYCFFEVSSAFQKAIRRCDEKQAMYWAVELYESGYQKYAWKRMLVMASEDVGLGEPTCITTVVALKQSFDYMVSLKDKHKPEKLPFTHAVLYLVKSRKSRYVDLAISVYWDMNKSEKLTIPDYVFDMHTRKGKQMGRSLEHFYKEGAYVNKPNKMDNEEEMELLAMKVDMKCSHKQEVNEDVELPEYKDTTLFQSTK